MKASVLDLRRRMREILAALDRNEPVTITYRGKEKAIMLPITEKKRPKMSAVDHPSFGMWRDREDIEDVDKFVRSLRKRRYSDL